MDITQAQSALALATTVLGVTSQAASTLETIKKMFSASDRPDDDEAAKLLNTLANELTTANIMNMQLSEALKTLSRELQRQDDFEREKARYELHQTNQKDIVYKLKAEAASGQPEHFICPVCLNNDATINFITGAGDYKVCQRDRQHTFRFASSPAVYTSGQSRTNFDDFLKF